MIYTQSTLEAHLKQRRLLSQGRKYGSGGRYCMGGGPTLLTSMPSMKKGKARTPRVRGIRMAAERPIPGWPEGRRITCGAGLRGVAQADGTTFALSLRWPPGRCRAEAELRCEFLSE